MYPCGSNAVNGCSFGTFTGRTNFGSSYGSKGSMYGDNARQSPWEIWEQTNNSSYGSKPSNLDGNKKTSGYRGNRLCTILLATAAFVVVVAVLTVASLAFYMGAIRTQAEESTYIVIRGSFNKCLANGPITQHTSGS